MTDQIIPKFDFSKKHLKKQDFLSFLVESLEDEFHAETKEICFIEKHFKTKRTLFEINDFAVQSRTVFLEDWRKVESLDFSTTHQNYIILAMLILVSIFNQKELKVKLTHPNSMIRQVIIRPIDLSYFSINIKKIIYSYKRVHAFIDNLFEENQKLEFIQTSGKEEINPRDLDWEKDRNIMLIQGDIFKLFNTAQLFLNFAHPYNKLIDDIKLTGYVGYVENLSPWSTNIHLWLPKTVGYFLNDPPE
ncbi:hypothetical protein [Acinetobacter sp. CFCC 10889]|uniref:hypothetical protein n=1 Tax=Acinetobacter sp. CFCC 10889 TaxID=1775557 RepID=UPI000DD09AD4|nr:hypothetical protein [Acinetobacter sp. CFCC 10889]